MNRPRPLQEIQALIQDSAPQNRAGEGGVGPFLRLLRKKRRASLAQIAEQSGIARVTLNRWELGTHRPYLPELEAVLKVLDASSQEREQALALVGTPRAVEHLRQQANAQAELLGGTRLFAVGNRGGELLCALRRRQGLSQEQVTARLGIPRQTLSRWETGETAPPAERVGELLDVLGARAEERAALASARLSLSSVLPEQGSVSLQALKAALCDIVYSPRGHDPAQEALKDLSYLTFEARLTPLALQQTAARVLLVEAYACHAHWLANNSRLREAAGYADRALELARHEQLRDNGWQRAVIVSAQAAVFRGTCARPERGIALLDSALKTPITPKFESWLIQELAEYLSLQNRTDAALTLSAHACALAERGGDTVERRLRCLDHARLLLRAGRESEALAALSGDSGLYGYSPFPLYMEYLLRSEALLRAGDVSEAHDWLTRAYTLAAEYQLNTRQADVLSRRF